MTHLAPYPKPIPPELPRDPMERPPDPPINTPPEKGPTGPEPLPPRPIVPPVPPALGIWFAIWVVVATVALLGTAIAEHSAGKDTSELEQVNRQQAECSRITNGDERRRCIERNQPSGAPATGKPTGDQPADVKPSVDREQRYVPSGETRKPTNPNRPELSR